MGSSWHRAGEVSPPGSGQALGDGVLPGLAYPHLCLWRTGMIRVPRRYPPDVQVRYSLCRRSPRLCNFLHARELGSPWPGSHVWPAFAVLVRCVRGLPPGQRPACLSSRMQEGLACMMREARRRCPEGWRGDIFPVPSFGMYPEDILIR